MKKLACYFAALVIALGVPTMVNADLINFGVDILNDGTAVQVAGGTTGDDTGHFISGNNDYIQFTIVTTFPSGTTAINAAQLFIDANDVGSGDGLGWTFRIRANDYVSTWVTLGELADTIHSATYVPVLYGPFGTKILTPYAGDVDNSFFDLGASLLDNVLNQDLIVMIDVQQEGWLVDEARIDAANLQVQYTHTSVPEPASLLLLGIGLVGLAAARMNRKA